MHFRALRVINEDWVAPARVSVPTRTTHGIITYVLEGALEHKTASAPALSFVR